jgi:hypothetical protein
MNPYLIPQYNLKWLEEKLTFGFRSKSSAPPPPPKKSQAEIDADNRRDAELREEKHLNKRKQKRSAQRRYGKRSLMSDDERGLSDTLG